MTQRASVTARSPSAQCPPALVADASADDDDIDRLLLRAGVPPITVQIDAAHALIVADSGLPLLRALLHRGCPAATCVRQMARPEALAYDLTFFPNVTPDTPLERMVRDARRAMMPGGRLVARVRFDPSGHTTRELARRLALNGFIRVRTTTLLGRTLLHADRPATDRLIHAPKPASVSSGPLSSGMRS